MYIYIYIFFFRKGNIGILILSVFGGSSYKQVVEETVYRAVELNLKRKEDFCRMQRTAMQSDYYWPKAMDEYLGEFRV